MGYPRSFVYVACFTQSVNPLGSALDNVCCIAYITITTSTTIKAIAAQMDLVEEAVEALGIVVWSMDRFEADDALATAANSNVGHITVNLRPRHHLAISLPAMNLKVIGHTANNILDIVK